MPALSIVTRNDAPVLTAPRQALRLITRDGEVVDPFLRTVEALVAFIKAEYGRSFAADLVSCPTQRVSMPEEYTKEQISRAVDLVKEGGWEIYPTYCGNMKTFWVRTHDLFA
jgi:hypothetical protein